MQYLFVAQTSHTLEAERIFDNLYFQRICFEHILRLRVANLADLEVGGMSSLDQRISRHSATDFSIVARCLDYVDL